MTYDEAVARARGSFGEELRKVATSYIAPLFWETKNERGEVALRNGTAFFLDAGEGPFAVTAAHVYQACLEAKRQNPKLRCQLKDLSFEPEDRLIEHGDPKYKLRPDVTTFRVTQEEVEKLQKRVVTGGQQTWPPTPPEEGKGVFFAGFPGRDRVLTDIDEVEFGIFNGLLTVESVSDRDILCAVEEEHLIETPGQGPSAPPDYDVSGVSGAPLLTVVEGAVLSWRLGGVIYKALEGSGMIFAARAKNINPDGTLNPYY